MADSRKRTHATVAAAVALVIVGGALGILLPLFTRLDPVPLVAIVIAAALFSAAVVFALFSRSDPPTPAPHPEQAES